MRYDQRVCELIKRFNALQAAAQTKVELLDKLQTEHDLMSQVWLMCVLLFNANVVVGCAQQWFIVALSN